MKKILIFSDTHGDINRCLDIIEKADSVSAIFHAGDYTGDAEDLESIYPNIPIYYVKGNNDYFSKAPSHMLVTIDGVKIFITHGHEQNVKYEYEFMTLRKAAEKYDPDLIIFGHTHIPYTDYKGKATLLNPGRPNDFSKFPNNALIPKIPIVTTADGDDIADINPIQSPPLPAAAIPP